MDETQHAQPTILDLFARAVRDQMRDETTKGFCGLSHDEVPLQTRRAEMSDWFRNLYIPNAEADAYITAFIEQGFDSLEALSVVSEDIIRSTVPKAGHQTSILRALPCLCSLTTLPRQECSWEWDDGIPAPANENESSANFGGKNDEDGAPAAGSAGAGGSEGSGVVKEINFYPFDRDVTRRIETARLTRQRDIVVMAGHNQKYRIDLCRMKQVNMRTGYKRDIRRVPPLDSKLINAPNSMLCPIGLNVMTDPVMAADGHSYERANIERWLTDHDTSPKTMLKLPSKSLTPNHSLRSAIEEFKQIIS